jgi:hypothetical protein
MGWKSQSPQLVYGFPAKTWNNLINDSTHKLARTYFHNDFYIKVWRQGFQKWINCDVFTLAWTWKFDLVEISEERFPCNFFPHYLHLLELLPLNIVTLNIGLITSMVRVSQNFFGLRVRRKDGYLQLIAMIGVRAFFDCCQHTIFYRL